MAAGRTGTGRGGSATAALTAPATTGWRPPVENQQGWGTVMYIPAAPWCPRNERYAAPVRAAFASGSSPDDFPAGHYERDWAGRFGPAGLNETGRRGLGLA